VAKLIINAGHSGLDGEYELDSKNGGFNFTKAEWYLMKKNVGVVVGDFAPGQPMDVSVMTALGLVLLRRAGKETLFDAFMETTDSETTWEWDSSEVVEVPDAVDPPIGSGSPASE